MISVLALLGSFWGLIGALVLAGIRFANSSEPERDALSTMALALAYGMPFVLALAAVFWKTAAQRSAVWLAAGILALLASFTALSGVSLIFLPAVPLLILAAIFSAARALDSAGWRTAVPVSLVLIGVGISAFLALVTLSSDPGCWVLIRYTDRHQAWQVAPQDAASIAVVSGPNSQQAFGYGQSPPPSNNGSSIISSQCTSDIFSPVESGVSVGLWCFAGAGLLLFRRYWSASPVFGVITKG